MPKTKKLSGRESVYMLLPWSCKHRQDRSEIEAYVPATGDWETIAKIRDAAGVDAEVLAGFITRAVNGYEKSRNLITQMVAALDLCLACDGKLTWEAEQETQAVLTRARSHT